jgi:hypothetical protein
MCAMPRPTKVWMVPLGRTPMVEIGGTLSLDEEGLLFAPGEESAPATRLRLDAIWKIARLRGSPVLMVTHADGGGAKTQTAFYFTKPPALANIVKSRAPERPAAAEPDPLPIPRPMPFWRGGRPPTKRKSVRTNATYLAQEGTNRKRELQAWVDEVRAQLGR